MNWYSVSPGSMGLCAAAIKLLGIDNVEAGYWPGPIYILCTPKDCKLLIELVNEANPDHQVTAYPDKKRRY